MTVLIRKYAWDTIRSATRSYAKHPTDHHAQKVEEAWKEMRRMESLSHWREWREARLNQTNGSDRVQ